MPPTERLQVLQYCRIATRGGSRGLLWVISGHSRVQSPCPLYPQKRPSPDDNWISAKCQKRTWHRLRQRHWDGYNRVLQTGHSRYADSDLLSVPAIHKDGSTISVEFTVTPIKDETGKFVGMAAVMRDVTKQFQEMRALKGKLNEH